MAKKKQIPSSSGRFRVKLEYSASSDELKALSKRFIRGLRWLLVIVLVSSNSNLNFDDIDLREFCSKRAQLSSSFTEFRKQQQESICKNYM